MGSLTLQSLPFFWGGQESSEDPPDFPLCRTLENIGKKRAKRTKNAKEHRKTQKDEENEKSKDWKVSAVF